MTWLEIAEKQIEEMKEMSVEDRVALLERSLLEKARFQDETDQIMGLMTQLARL